MLYRYNDCIFSQLHEGNRPRSQKCPFVQQLNCLTCAAVTDSCKQWFHERPQREVFLGCQNHVIRGRCNCLENTIVFFIGLNFMSLISVVTQSRNACEIWFHFYRATLC